VTSRDQIASIVAKPTAPYLDHRKIGLGQGKKEALRLFDTCPKQEHFTLYIDNNFQAQVLLRLNLTP
jgi:hypothetical protein